MSRWKDFEQANPEMSAFGKARFQSGVAYLGTIRPDGGPRVHPVTPIIGADLFLFMEPTSPKGKDLERDGRFTLHCGVEDNSGGGGEFYLRGTAKRVTDPLIREKAIKASSYTPNERYILFVLTVDFAFMNQYIEGKPTVQRWDATN